MSEYSTQKKPRRAVVKDNKKRNLIIFISAAAAVVIVLVILLISGVFSPNAKYIAAVKGSWKVDPITIYEFDGSGKGTLHTSVADYPFTYTADETHLSMDFELESAKDTEYVYTLSDTTLILNNHGTKYELTKAD